MSLEKPATPSTPVAAPFPPYADVETSSDDYARRFAGASGEFLLGVQTRLLLDLVAPFPGATVLDVGGGHAQTAAPLAEAGYDVTVVGSRESCRVRIDRLRTARPVRFRVGDLLALPFEANSFDVAIAFRLLTHVEAWQSLVAELTRVARRAVILDYPELASVNLLTTQLFGLKRRIEHNTRPYTCYRRREVEAALAASGFDRFTARPEFFAPMVLHRVLNSGRASRTIESAARGVGLTSKLGSPVILRAEAAMAPAAE